MTQAGPIPTQRNVDPTWTWGSSALLRLSPTLGSQNSVQLAQVSLPEPAVCSLYLSATARITNPAVTSVGAFTVNLSQGLGRVTVPRQVTFGGQPSDQSPIEWTLPFIPLHALQVDCEATGDFRNETGGEIEIQIYLVIAPITRIPQKIQQLQFGMAEPGEADALDDELRENLEEESPTVADIMGREAHQRVHGAAEPSGAPEWMLDLVDALTARLGRQPKPAELAAAVERVRARSARRGRRA